jgi:hypothetical protein
VKLLYVKFIVVYVRRREEEAGGGEGARDTESKTRTPHKDVGNKTWIKTKCLQKNTYLTWTLQNMLKPS